MEAKLARKASLLPITSKPTLLDDIVKMSLHAELGQSSALSAPSTSQVDGPELPLASLFGRLEAREVQFIDALGGDIAAVEARGGPDDVPLTVEMGTGQQRILRENLMDSRGGRFATRRPQDREGGLRGRRCRGPWDSSGSTRGSCIRLRYDPTPT